MLSLPRQSWKVQCSHSWNSECHHRTLLKAASGAGSLTKASATPSFGGPKAQNHPNLGLIHNLYQLVVCSLTLHQETNEDQIEELPAPSRIPSPDNSPTVVFTTTETTFNVKVVGQPGRQNKSLGHWHLWVQTCWTCLCWKKISQSIVLVL